MFVFLCIYMMKVLSLVINFYLCCNSHTYSHNHTYAFILACTHVSINNSYSPRKKAAEVKFKVGNAMRGPTFCTPSITT